MARLSRDFAISLNRTGSLKATYRSRAEQEAAVRSYFEGGELKVTVNGVETVYRVEGWEAVLEKECGPGQKYKDHPELIVNFDETAPRPADRMRGCGAPKKAKAVSVTGIKTVRSPVRGPHILWLLVVPSFTRPGRLHDYHMSAGHCYLRPHLQRHPRAHLLHLQGHQRQEELDEIRRPALGVLCPPRRFLHKQGALRRPVP